MKTDTPNENLSSVNMDFEETKLTKMTSKAREKAIKETKTVKKPRKSSLKHKFNALKTKSQKSYAKTLKKVERLRKSRKKLTKAQRLENKQGRNRVILGIGLLLVVVSIAYSTTVTRYFVDSTASLVALAPQTIFAVIIIFKAFSKLYK